MMKTMKNWMKGMALAVMVMTSTGLMAQANVNNRGGLVVTEHGVSMVGGSEVAGRNEVRGRNDQYGEGRYGDNRRDDCYTDDRYTDSRDLRRDDRNGSRYDDRRYQDNRSSRNHDGVYAGRGHAINDPYAGRVRRMNDGRWGYLRDNCWYYYDCYFEPAYYYSHPVHHFHRHRLGPVGKAIVATAAVVGLVHALVH